MCNLTCPISAGEYLVFSFQCPVFSRCVGAWEPGSRALIPAHNENFLGRARCPYAEPPVRREQLIWLNGQASWPPEPVDQIRGYLVKIPKLFQQPEPRPRSASAGSKPYRFEVQPLEHLEHIHYRPLLEHIKRVGILVYPAT